MQHNKVTEEKISKITKIANTEPQYVYDIEVNDDTHTFVANDILVHNSVYVSFEPVFKSMTEESQKKFASDDAKLKFIADFSKGFLNAQNNEWCESLYAPRHAKSYHEFELESIQKTQLVDKKKKYIKGVVWMKGKKYDEPKISATGIEVVRSSTPKLCREILTDMIRDIMFVSPKYNNKNEYALYFNDILREKKAQFIAADIQDISNSVSIGDYKKYVIDDKDALRLRGQCPVSVKAAARFNWMAHKNGQDNLRAVSGKIKYYYINGDGNKGAADYFGYPIGIKEQWFPKPAIQLCWEKNVIVPLNRFTALIGMPELTADCSVTLSLF